MSAESVTPIESSYEGRKLTPMLRQYVEAKAGCPADCILMFRMGDFFELFFEDAVIAARELDLTLTARDKSEDAIPMAGVPHHAVNGYIARLVERGFSVAICDQVEDPKKAKGLVKRELTRLITPGTATDLESLNPASNSYLASVLQKDDGSFCIAVLDLLAGELLVTSCASENLGDELRRMGVREVLTRENIRAQVIGLIGSASPPVRAFTAEALSSADAAAFLMSRFATTFIAGYSAGGSADDHCALAELIRYAEQTQRRVLRHLMAPRAYRVSDYVVLDEATRRNLELSTCNADNQRQGSLLWHLDRCRTAMGSRLLSHWLLFPLREAAAINQRLDIVGALKSERPLREKLAQALDGVRDMERLIGRVAVGRITPKDLAALRESLRRLPRVQEAVLQSEAVLAQQWQAADIVGDIATLLETALTDDPPYAATDGGIFRRGYKSDLDELLSLASEGHEFLNDLEQRERERSGISSLKVRYNRVFGYYLEVTKANLRQVPADYQRKQTLVGAERFITPELKTYEDKVLNAEERRAEREQELFDELVEILAAATQRLRAISRLVAETDALMSLAQVADEGRYCRPSLVDECVLELQEARHPVLERLLPGGERFVPNDLHIDVTSRQLLIVTGPNMAGKSTVMRQAALCAIMAHMGSYVPAKSARVGLCDRIFTRVGASDNLSRGQSTFMVEMHETATILRHATARSLVLLDEIGRGTSTYDGVSIAWAVAEFMHDQVGCRAMFATHYHELTDLSRERPRVINVSMLVKEVDGRVAFLRRMVEGGANRSYGIAVAELAGVPQPVLERAKEILANLERGETEIPATPIIAAPRLVKKRRQELRKQLSLFGRN